MLETNPVLLIDGSCLLYIHGADPNYERSIITHLDGLMFNNNSSRYVGILDGPSASNFRMTVDPEYKQNRDKSTILEKFPYFYEVKTLLIERFKFIVINGIESDDLISIINNKLMIESCIINNKVLPVTSYSVITASIDKDLNQIEGYHFNIKTNDSYLINKPFLELSLDRKKLIGGSYMLTYAQTLIGDKADNIKGINRYGPVKTYELLKDCKSEEECKQKVLTIYKEIYGDKAEEEFLKTYNLVYILKNNNNLNLKLDIHDYSVFN